MIRRSRCLVVVCGVFFLTQLALITLLKLSTNPRLNDYLDLGILDIRKILILNDDTESRLDFNKLVDKKFEEKSHAAVPLQRLNESDLWLLDMSRSANRLILDTAREPSEILKTRPLFDFDPRLSFTLLFHYLNEKTAEPSIESIQNTLLPYFHWSDWTNLTVLHDYMIDRGSCSGLFDFRVKSKLKNMRQELFDPATFCYDDAHLEEIYESLDEKDERKASIQWIMEDKFSPGFHVFKFGGRSSSKVRALEAKSYMNDFMKPPKQIVFLFPPPKQESALKSIPLILKVPQDLKSKQRLSHTDVFSLYFDSRDSSTNEGLLIDYDTEYNKLLNSLSQGADSVSHSIPYNIKLTEEDFIDNSSAILEQIEKMPVSSLSDMDIAYKESLQYSLSIRMPPKYFNEAKIVRTEKNYGLGGHYDWRFFNGFINFSNKHKPALYGIMRAWLSFTNTFQITTWIAHGSLLSWYWDGVSFPWDNDIDVQMPISELHRISREFNQSVIVDLGENDSEARFGRYFLDCGSSISSRTRLNGNNNIDARFIDMDTGLYIDVTGIALSNAATPDRYDDKLPKELGFATDVPDIVRNQYLQIFNCRNHHFSSLQDLSPLRLSILEGVYAYVPNDFERILQNEYGNKGTTLHTFKTFTFLPKLNMWVETKVFNAFIASVLPEKQITKQGNIGKEIEAAVSELSEENYLKFLEQNPGLLMEYLITRNVTLYHNREMELLFRGEDTQILIFDSSGEFKPHFQPLRHDYNLFLSYFQGEKVQDALLLHEYDFPRVAWFSGSSEDNKLNKRDPSQSKELYLEEEDNSLPPLLADFEDEARKVKTQESADLDDLTINREFSSS